MYITTKIKRTGTKIDCDYKDDCQYDQNCKSCQFARKKKVKTTEYVKRELLFEDLGFKGKILRIFMYVLLLLLVVVMPLTVVYGIGRWIFS